MNDTVFSALLKLSYFIVKQNNVADEEKFLWMIKDYLQRFNIVINEDILLSKFNAQEHLLLPSQKNYQQYSKKGDIKSICLSFDTELLLHEKFFVAICLVECTSKSGLHTRKTKDIIRQLIFNCGINSKEFESINEFILENDEQRLVYLSDLFISNSNGKINDELEGAWIEKNRPSEMGNIPNIVYDNINGKIFFHYQQSLNHILFKYTGDNTIYVNKELVKPGELYLFKNKDKLIFDNKVIIDYKELSNRILTQFTRKSVVFTGNSVEYNSKRQFNSIKRFTFSEKSGSLIGVIGGKYSEKNVLIKLLAGELKADNGNIIINCYDTNENNFKTQGLIGYVPAESRLRAGLTIYENYYYISKLFLRHYTNRKIKELILEIFNELGLQNIKSVIWDKHTKENFSELHYKLICLGLELVKDPSILILEEIFEGLTPMETQVLIGVLREQAMKGKLIIASSTPPLLFNVKEFDSVWLFDKGGYPIYNGKPDTVLSYFSELSKKSIKDADVDYNLEVWQIINKNTINLNGEYTTKRKTTPKDWYNLYNENLAPKIKIHGFRDVLPQSRVKLPNLDKQLFIFLIRDLKAFFRQPSLFLTYFTVVVLLGLLTGLFCRHSSSGTYSFSTNENLSFFYFVNTINSLLLGTWIGVGAINREGAFYRLNKLYNLSSISYFSAKISLHILLMTVLLSTYVIVSYSIVEHLAVGFRHFLVYLLIGVAGNTLGYNISIYTKRLSYVYFLSIILIFFQILFSGQIVPFEKFPVGMHKNKKYVPLIAELSILKWGHEALMVDQVTDNRYSRNLFEEQKFLALAEIYNDIVLPELQKKVNNCFYMQEENEDAPVLQENLTVLKTEIEKIPENFDVFRFEFVSNLNVENFNEEVGLECINYINYIQYYLYEESEIRKEKLAVKIDSISTVDKLKDKFYNESVYRIATNITKDSEGNNSEVAGLSSIPSKYQVYISPDSNIGRSHLYAYQKLFNGQNVNTYWFNILVLWLSVGVAYLFLVTEFIHFARNILNKYVRNY